MDWFAVADEATPALRRGDLDTCRAIVTAALEKMPRTPYHLVMDVEFTNPPLEVARYCDAFSESARKELDVKAIYGEMNGFYINPDLWYFELFAFDNYGGHEDYDWLSDWDHITQDSLVLTGMEALQQVYATVPMDSNPAKSAEGLASLLVVVKFQQLVQRAIPLMKQKNVPILATAHEFDFIFEG
ncbi:MAG: hypothetical protein GX557_08690 [Chloroflexi bacterium]|nr:hypothetical protein [Chloroflexota bacterium]